MVCPGLECIQSTDGVCQKDSDLILHLDDPGVLSLIIGVPLLEHGLGDHLDSVGKLVIQEADVVFHDEVKIVGFGALVMTDGGCKVAECLLLLCDPGCQFPDHFGQPDAGVRDHTDMGVESWQGEVVSSTWWLLG